MNDVEILILKEKNISDFAEARNKLLMKSKSDWVMFLDSDEKMSNGLIKEVLDLDLTDYSGFIIKRKIVFLGKEIGEDRVLRLGRKNAGGWVRKVHETWQIKGKVGYLKNYIIHNTANNLHDYIGKINSYSSIHASENLKEGKHSNILEIILLPKLKFIQNLLMGRGFVFGMLQSFHSFLAWSKQWELTCNTGQAK